MTEKERFDKVFYTLLNEDPNRAPSPTKIRALMGLPPRGNLNGRLSSRRIYLLRLVGFKKDPFTGRWKP